MAHKNHRSKHKNRNGHKKALLFFAVLAVVAIPIFLTKKTHNDKIAKEAVFASQPVTFNETPKKGVLRSFTGAEFRDLYNNFAYPNTKLISEDTPITGNLDADKHIRGVALMRGYKIRSAPVTDTFMSVGPDMKLQERAAGSWPELQAAAKKDGESLNLTAAYRSANEQKTIFLDKLSRVGLSISGIASGKYDTQLSDVLRTTAVPGYSRHHTGYTVDIGCENDPSVVFEASSCFSWLSKDNYKNAKTAGWIPSYPDGAGKQGPDPEPWEYVWVGKDALTE